MLKSPIKWVGGKQKLVKLLLQHVPENYNTYFEPFFGGGSLFFALNPKKAYVCDLNKDLIYMYHGLSNEPEKVAELLLAMPNTEEDYYRIRDTKPFLAEEVAARFLYLNHAGYNGLYRVNKSGKFNVAYGKRKKLSYDTSKFREIGERFNDIKCVPHVADYKTATLQVRENDFVYLDPPYYGTFNAYTSQFFGEEDLNELAACVDFMVASGAKVLISNSNHEVVREVFSKYTIIPVDVAWTVGQKGSTRAKKDNELLIKTW